LQHDPEEEETDIMSPRRPMEGKSKFSNSRLMVGVAWSQGERESMQDTFSLVLNHGDDTDVDFIGLFDGHGKNGENVARYVNLLNSHSMLHLAYYVYLFNNTI
jgi:serine/threonine protein phosphatase PrpC